MVSIGGIVGSGGVTNGEMGVDGGLLIRSQVSFETIALFAKVQAAHTVLIVVRTFNGAQT